MRKPLSVRRLSDKLELHEYADGFWLWDDVFKGNLSVRAKTPEAALVECLAYYQHRLPELQAEHNLLKSRVNAFVSQLVESDPE